MSDSAFPEIKSKQEISAVSAVWSEGGLTKREYFAAKALQGLASAQTGEVEFDPKAVAIGAAKLADALIKRLAKGESDGAA